MGRKERREEERARRAGKAVPGFGGWTPPTNRVQEARMFPAGEAERLRQGQDFMAGTAFAAGAGVLFAGPALDPADAGPVDLPTPFAVYVHEDEQTFGPAPQLRELFALLDERGAIAVYDQVMTNVATSWALLDHPDEPLVKLKLDFRATDALTGRAEILLLAGNYADQWHHIAGGGMVAISTLDRMHRAATRPGATMADGMEAALLVGVGGSPAIQQLIANHRWPS